MEVSVDLSLLLILCGVSLIAGFIDAVVGGGGMLTIPALLTSGLPPHIVLGTNKLAASFGSLTSSITFYRKGLFKPKFWKQAIVCTALGSILGTLMVTYLSTQLLEKALPVLVMLTAVYTLFVKPSVCDNNTLPTQNFSLQLKQALQGSLLGFYDGIAGPGTGAFWLVSSTMLYKINILLASGLARSANFISNICSLITFIYLGHIHLVLGLCMGVFIMLGAYIGSHWAIKHGGKFIRPVFILVVLAMSVKLAFDAWLL